MFKILPTFLGEGEGIFLAASAVVQWQNIVSEGSQAQKVLVVTSGCIMWTNGLIFSSLCHRDTDQFIIQAWQLSKPYR